MGVIGVGAERGLCGTLCGLRRHASAARRTGAGALKNKPTLPIGVARRVAVGERESCIPLALSRRGFGDEAEPVPAVQVTAGLYRPACGVK